LRRVHGADRRPTSQFLFVVGVPVDWCEIATVEGLANDATGVRIRDLSITVDKMLAHPDF
jgi:hypothetical protein